MYDAFCWLSPAARSAAGGTASISSAVGKRPGGNNATNLPKMAAAAFPESCCQTIDSIIACRP